MLTVITFFWKYYMVFNPDFTQLSSKRVYIRSEMLRIFPRTLVSGSGSQSRWRDFTSRAEVFYFKLLWMVDSTPLNLPNIYQFAAFVLSCVCQWVDFSNPSFIFPKWKSLLLTLRLKFYFQNLPPFCPSAVFSDWDFSKKRIWLIKSSLTATNWGYKQLSLALIQRLV